MEEDLKAWCQQHHCEALAQLAVHEGSREALLREGSVVPALEEYEAKLRDSEAKLAAQRQEYEAKLRDSEAKLDAQRHESEAKLRDCEAKLDAQAAKNCASDVQLERLQEWLDALHQAKLLTDDEMFALEDLVADFIECRFSVTASLGEIGTSTESARKLVGMCEAVSKDSMLARQLRRKFL